MSVHPCAQLLRPPLGRSRHQSAAAAQETAAILGLLVSSEHTYIMDGESTHRSGVHDSRGWRRRDL